MTDLETYKKDRLLIKQCGKNSYIIDRNIDRPNGKRTRLRYHCIQFSDNGRAFSSTRPCSTIMEAEASLLVNDEYHE